MSNKQYRVLHIFSGFGGGISSLVWNLARNINGELITMDVLSFTKCSEEFENDINRVGGKVFVMPRPRVDGFNKFKNYVIEVMKVGKYDVVHCHISEWRAFMFRKFANQCLIDRFIVHAHRTSNEKKTSKLKIKFHQYFSVKASTELATCSHMAAEFIFGDKALKHRNITSIPNGVQIEKYVQELTENARSRYNKEFGVKNNQLIIGHIGRFNLQKNHAFMVRLIRYLSNKNIDFVWLFIGTGDLEDKIKREISEYNLEKSVRFIGRRDDVNQLVKYMYVMVLPSHYEGLPTVAIEAQASGTPSVLADTITKECDLQLGLIEFVSLNMTMERWSQSIIQAASSKVVDSNTIKSIFEEKGYTAKKAARIYENFIQGKLTQ